MAEALMKELTATVYELSVQEHPWQKLARTMRETFDCSSVTVNFGKSCRSADSVFIADAEWDFTSDLNLYLESGFNSLNPVRPDDMVEGRIYKLLDFIPYDELKEQDFYVNYCKKIHVEHAFFCYLGRLSGLDTWISGSRDEKRGPFKKTHLDSISRFLPDFRRAVAISLNLHNAKGCASAYADSLSDIGVGILHFTSDGELIHRNDLARDWLSFDLAEAGQSPDIRNQLMQKLRSIAIDIARSGAESSRFHVLTEGGVTTSVVARRASSAEFMPDALRPVQIYLHRRTSLLSERAVAFVMTFLGLTATEARYVILVSDGYSVQEIAEQLNITLESARTYGKRVLMKTGFHRKIELVSTLWDSLAKFY